MSRAERFFALLGVILASAALAAPAGRGQDLDVEYAEPMPLADRSVLLDITRAGGTLVAVGERGHVLLSADGETWQQAEHVPTRSTLTSVAAAGGRLWAGGHDAVIITSGDGGNTWTRQFFEPERQQAVMDIVFTDEDNGQAIGSYGLYLRTFDGGRTWEEATVDPDNDYHLNQLVHFDDGQQLIAGEAGYSYRSDDGENWERLDLPYQGSMWGALRTAGDCVLFFGLRGHVQQSCDFGSSWTELETPTESSISGAAGSGRLVLLAANSGVLLTRTGDGPFAAHQHSSGVDFSAAIALGNQGFLLTGEDGFHRYPETGGLEGGHD